MKKCLGDKDYFMGAMVVLGAVLTSAILNNNAFATEASLTITISSGNVSANVAPFADSTGTFVQSEAINVGVATDNVTGYNLGIKANNATYPERLINSTDNSYLSSISTATNLATFKATDLSSITTSGGNQGVWGYLPSKFDSADNVAFQPTPGTAGHTIEQTSASNSTANTYTISLGAKVSPLATVGAYTNSFVITATGNPIPYTISFSENTVSGMPDNILDGSSGNTSATIPSDVPTRAGYRFLGWCDQATTKSGDTDTCATGHDHQPGGTLTLDATGANNVKLYAMWGPVIYMQDLTASAIATLLPNQHSTTTVYDKRDDQEYTIAKLKDGKYWMVENLNIAGGTALSSDDTDFESTYTLPTTNGWTTNNGKLVLPASSTSGFSTDNYAYVYNSGNKTNCGAEGQDTPCYSYYSWDVATLGSGRSIGTDNTDAPYSVCPKGWRLPTSRTTSATNWQTESDFYSLAHQYGLDSTTSTSGSDDDIYTQAGPGTTPNFLLAGLYGSGSFYNGGSDGYYWSSTSYSSTTSARYLHFYNSGFGSAYYNGRRNGYGVRCIFGGGQ